MMNADQARPTPYREITGQFRSEKNLVKLTENGGYDETNSWLDFKVEKSNQRTIEFSGKRFQSLRERNNLVRWTVDDEAPAFEGTTTLDISTQANAGTSNNVFTP